MIKRDGKLIGSYKARDINKAIADETLSILTDKIYFPSNAYTVNIGTDLDFAINNTVLYNEPLPAKQFIASAPNISVTDETTAKAGQRFLLEGEKEVAILNFASARTPGGGFLSGATAQEEDLCRASGLYSCLKSKPSFYNDNLKLDHHYYTDDIIYSPNVPFFRDEYNILIANPFLLSVISSPAPNVSAMEEVDNDKLFSVLYNRAIKILQVAELHNHKTIVLGGWGCGAFGNSPNLVAHIFLRALRTVPSFDNVCFAIYDTKPDQPVLNSFKKVIGI